MISVHLPHVPTYLPLCPKSGMDGHQRSSPLDGIIV